MQYKTAEACKNKWNNEEMEMKISIFNEKRYLCRQNVYDKTEKSELVGIDKPRKSKGDEYWSALVHASSTYPTFCAKVCY